MEKYAWKATIKEGCLDEYKRRHDALPDDMKDLLRECKNGVEFAAKTQNDSPVVARWDEYMSDILIMEKDPKTGAQPLLKKVFSFD